MIHATSAMRDDGWHGALSGGFVKQPVCYERE
jgi:hypothetical protein